MERSRYSIGIAQVGRFAATVRALALAGAAFALGSLPASAQSSPGAGPSPFPGAGPYYEQLVNGGGSMLNVAASGAVTECSGLLGAGDKPGLACKVIGTISVPTVGGIYELSAFGNSSNLAQGHLFRNWQNGVIWGCSQTTDANGLPNGQCVKFNSVPADPNAPEENQSTLTHGTRGTVSGKSWVTVSDMLSTGYVFECTTFLANGTSGAPTGRCAQIGTIAKVPSGDTISATLAGDVDFYFAVNSNGATTALGQCVRDYNSSTLAPVGACIK